MSSKHDVSNETDQVSSSAPLGPRIIRTGARAPRRTLLPAVSLSRRSCSALRLCLECECAIFVPFPTSMTTDNAPSLSCRRETRGSSLASILYEGSRRPSAFHNEQSQRCSAVYLISRALCPERLTLGPSITGACGPACQQLSFSPSPRQPVHRSLCPQETSLMRFYHHHSPASLQSRARVCISNPLR